MIKSFVRNNSLLDSFNQDITVPNLQKKQKFHPSIGFKLISFYICIKIYQVTMKESSYPTFLDKEPTIDNDIMNKIREIGILWKNSPNNPKLSKTVLDKWESVIGEWLADKSMPLIARKKTKTEGRGKVISHPSGRKVIISDNTFPDWMYSNILRGITYELSELKQMLDKDELPIAFSFERWEKAEATYTKTFSENLKFWKVCHIKAVGFNSRKSIKEIPIEMIEEHFRKLANPKNIFLLPKQIGSLGEIQLFIDEQ